MDIYICLYIYIHFIYVKRYTNKKVSYLAFQDIKTYYQVKLL